MSGMLSSESTGMASTTAAQTQQQQASSAMSDIINNRMIGCVAHVTFRVRCETLGYGEEVFLIAILDNDNNTGVSSSLLHSGKVCTNLSKKKIDVDRSSNIKITGTPIFFLIKRRRLRYIQHQRNIHGTKHHHRFCYRYRRHPLVVEVLVIRISTILLHFDISMQFIEPVFFIDLKAYK